MTDVAATTETVAKASPRRAFLLRGGSFALLLTSALVALADFLFYRHGPGLNLFIFVAALVPCIVALRGQRLHARPLVMASLVLLAASLPLLEAAGILSALSALFGLALFSLAVWGRLPEVLTDLPATLVRYAVLSPVRLGLDSCKFLVDWRGKGFGHTVSRTILIWIVPGIFALVFLVLFASANPIIELVLARIDIDYLLGLINIERLLLWSFVASLVWPLLLPRLLRWRKAVAAAKAEATPVARAESLVFGSAAILRSLIVFNALFAVQTALDVAYLWGGATLPDGMTYAAYAHRGAYPLIVTALLAAAFVLAAMRRNGPGEASRPIRILVYVWIAQNVLLVLSSILRLDLYVEVYTLTELRIAAGIWMGLVAAGLVLILARIVTRKSNKWLIAMNLATLGLTLYACGFVNFSALISRFNVEHSRQLSGQGYSIDLDYLLSLGVEAIPALDLYLAGIGREAADVVSATNAKVLRDLLEADFAARDLDWRAWSFRDWRLANYLGHSQQFPILPRSDNNRVSD